MKKKLYMFGMVMTLGLTCIGCGNKDVAVNTEAAAETTTEVTTEEITTETEKATTEKTTRETTEEKTTESKTSDKESEEKKTDTKKVTDATGGNTTVASNTNTQSSSTPSSSGQTSNNTTPQTTECQHNWEAVTHTVHHDAVMGERITKSAVYAHWYCYNCQRYFLTHQDDPCWGISSNGSEASYCLEPAVRETYEVTPAYDETITDYYKCSKCGATK
ncbi:MAG: hypothetical protein ACI4GW_01560 [Lachnospiraceae bacterium]